MCMENQDGPAMFISISIRIVHKRRADQGLKKIQRGYPEVVPVFPARDGKKRRKTFWKRVFRSFLSSIIQRERRRTGGGAFGDTYRDHRKGEGI